MGKVGRRRVKWEGERVRDRERDVQTTWTKLWLATACSYWVIGSVELDARTILADYCLM